MLSADKTYSFYLTVYDYDTIGPEPGYSMLTMPPNRPPRNGTCDVLPRKVQALEEQISIFCDSWVDPDTSDHPLLYYFSVEQCGPDPEWYPLYRGYQSSGLFYLAPKAGCDKANIFLYVEDSLGGKTLAGIK